MPGQTGCFLTFETTGVTINEPVGLFDVFPNHGIRCPLSNAAHAAKKVTIRDVAKAVGCSRAVVSTVLNKSKGNTVVGQEMRERVVAVSKQMGYRPNYAAQNLARRMTRTVGIYVVPVPWSSMGRNYGGLLLCGIEAMCRKADYDLMVLNLTGQEPVEKCLDKLAENRVDGLILIHAENGLSDIERFRQVMPNLVAVDTTVPLPGIDSVVFDNAAAVRLAIEHLVALGHREIGLIGHCIDNPLVSELARQQAFVGEMKAAGLKVNPDWIYDRKRFELNLSFTDHYCQVEGYWGTRHLMGLKHRPTAVVAPTVVTSMGIYWAMEELKLSIPHDLAVVSIGDSERAWSMSPMLTCVESQLELMGQLAAERVIQHAQCAGTSPDQSWDVMMNLVPPRLQIRGSTDPHSQSGLAALSRPSSPVMRNDWVRS